MKYEIVFTASAEKTLKKLPTDLQDRIYERIQELASDPKPTGYKQLKNFELPSLKIKPLFRIRIGDYRVIYAIENQKLIITVLKISHRSNVYK